MEKLKPIMTDAWNKKQTKLIKVPLKINDFIDVIPWAYIERMFGKQEYKRFEKWMRGQTCIKEGAYRGDVERYLEDRQRGIKDPAIYD